MIAEQVNLDSGLLWTVLVVLLIICCIVWLVRAFR